MSEELGHSNGSVMIKPESDYRDTRQRQQDFENQTQQTQDGMRRQMAAWQAEREECMKLASDHAGAIGLIYNAETNNFSRVASDETPPSAPPRPPRPELPKAPPRAITPRSAPSKALKWLEGFHWLLAIPVGMFVGYGLGTLAGVPLQRVPALAVVAMLIGISAIVGMKLLFGYGWHLVGRKEAMSEDARAAFGCWIGITAVFCLVEGWLGAYALMEYSRQTSFGDTPTLTLLLALPIALAISTPTLLISAVKAYRDGRNSLTAEDEAKRAQGILEQEHNREIARIEAEARQAQLDWEAGVRRQEAEHQAALQRSLEEQAEYDNHRKGPDYQALLKLIGRITTLNQLMEEKKRELDNYAISRGHGKVSVV